MDIAEFLNTLRTQWRLIVSMTIVGALGGMAATLAATPKFESSTELYVAVNGSSTANELAQGSTAAEQKVHSYIQVATSPRVLEPVIHDLHLATTPTELARQIKATSPAQSVLVEISVTDVDAAAAASIANAVASSLTKVVTDDLELSPSDSPTSVRMSVLGKAVATSVPANPRPTVNLVVGILLGLAAGICLGLLRTSLDTRVRDRGDVESLTSAPILGGIGFDRRGTERGLIVASDPTAPRSEAFRRLCTNIQYLDFSGKSRSFVVTSAVQGEGKSTTAANLAVAMAESGMRVALIDGDLRRPRVASTMGVEGITGLTDVLIGRLEVEDALAQWNDHSVWVLPAGAIPPNPAQLLSSAGMKSLVTHLEDLFDMVLIDAPPLLPVTDAALLAKISTGAVIVSSMNHTSRKQLSAAVTALADADAHLLGVIMNKVKSTRENAYVYKYAYVEGKSRFKRLLGSLR